MTNFRKWFKGEYPGGHTSGYYFAHKAWQYRQQEIDQLKAQLNNMETCYIEKKKQVEDALHILDELYRKGLFAKPKAVSEAINVLRGES